MYQAQSTTKVTLLLVSVFLSMFLVALDRTIISTVWPTPRDSLQSLCLDGLVIDPRPSADFGIFRGDTRNHKRIQLSPRRRVVRQRLLVDVLFVPAAVWQTLHLLPRQSGSPHEHLALRGQLCHLWSRAQLYSFHCGASHRRSGCRWNTRRCRTLTAITSFAQAAG